VSELPSGWTIASLGEIATDCQQQVPASEATFKYIDIASVDRQTKTITKPQTVVGEDAPSRARKLVRAGDVLVSMTRPNLNAVAMVPENLDGQIASTGFDVLRSNGIDPRWLFYLVRTQSFVDRMSELVQGALYPAVRSKDIRGYEVPVAPLNEQKRIADKLDAVLARVDACHERLDRVPDILKRFRQSVLAAATSGKLTEEWREANPQLVDATELAAQIHKAHEEAGGHRAGNAAPPTDDVHDLSKEMFPQGWELLTLRDLVQPDRPITYGILKPGPDFDAGVPYVRVADFPNDKLNLTTIRKTSPAIDQEFKRSRLNDGDILLSIRGTVGRLVVVPAQLTGANITQDSARLTIQSAVNRDYILWFLRSELAQARMKGAVKGVAVRGINIGDVRALQVPLPSRQEQEEIVRRVESLLAYADRLEARYTVAYAHVERLTPTLLAKAFRGELVPQDPSDEPAANLLERVRTQRAVAKSVVVPRAIISLAEEVEVIMQKLRDVLTSATDWLSVEEAFRRCGVSDGTSTDRIEELYAELRQLDKAGTLQVRRIGDLDELKLEPKA
jgi:type I restriction enzyme S subunit